MEIKLKQKQKSHYVEWAALFAAAAELTKRGYDVALTLGRTPKVDLLCSIPDKETFKVQVKGMSKLSGPWIQKHFLDGNEDPLLFFIMVNVPSKSGETFRFFIMTHKEIRQAWASRKTKHVGFEGLSFREIKDYEDHWKNLPNKK